MEEIKTDSANKKSKNKRALKRGTDFGLKILAIIVAVVIWFILSITQYPTINKTISGVPVDFIMEGTKAQEKGLNALNYKDITVDVEIKGMNYEIGNYTSNDLIATVNLDEVTKEGTYKLEIEVKSTHSTDKCSVVSVSPETIEVEFDRITTKEFELGAEAPLISADDGLTLKETSVEPSKITVEGAEKDLENISKVTAQIKKSKKISEDTTIEADGLVFYDADDNVLDSSKFTTKDQTYNVNFVVYKKKTANLSVDITGCPDNFDVTSLPMSLSEDSISIISPNLEDDDIEDVVLGSIPLNNITPYRTFDFKVPLNAGEINVAGAETITVSFSDDGYSSKIFSVDSDRIKIKNAPSDLTCSVETKKIANITIYGPTEIINKLSDEDIFAQIDLSEIHEVGSYTKEAIIYMPDYDNLWAYGSNVVQITAARKASKSSSEKE